MVVLDTDVVSAVMRGDPIVTDWLNRQTSSSVWTTTITIFEIRIGLAIMPAGRRRGAIEHAFMNVIASDLGRRILPLDRAAAEEAAILMSLGQGDGRMKGTADTMIAGIAVSQNATLATRNKRHFNDLSVPVVDPWHA